MFRVLPHNNNALGFIDDNEEKKQALAEATEWFDYKRIFQNGKIKRTEYYHYNGKLRCIRRPVKENVSDESLFFSPLSKVVQKINFKRNGCIDYYYNFNEDGRVKLKHPKH